MPSDSQRGPQAVLVARRPYLALEDHPLAPRLWAAGFGDWADDGILLLTPIDVVHATYQRFCLTCPLCYSDNSFSWVCPDELEISAYSAILDKGFYPRPGLAFGCDYLIYTTRTPDNSHAAYLLLILRDERCDRIPALCEQAARLRKQVLIAYLHGDAILLQPLELFKATDESGSTQLIPPRTPSSLASNS
ncbi:putative tRNA intron endonuclease [Giardia muris]|uniref:tRNA-intron lyase n=1 Tax=Giardia muris TaxID=5742 RepID=A0A4Z1SPB3_GIAMU|nr:putative tRNA intron endonuclease [Giardia muris]|eukprot:TNJ27480.1 putative tRNA intron endonuclease [Giardia muris]